MKIVPRPRNLNPLQNELEHGDGIVAVVVTESVLIEIGLKVFGANGMIDTRDTTLCQRPEAFDAVGMGIPIDIDLSTVSNSLVPVSCLRNPVIAMELVGVDDGSPSHIPLDEGHDCRTLDVGDNGSGDLPLPLDYANDGGFAFCSSSSLTPSNSAKIGLVNLDFAIKRDSIFAEQSPDLLEHSPRCLIGDASYPLKLFGGVPRAGSGHPEHSVKPGCKRCGRLVEDGIGGRVNLMPAVVALVARSALNPVVFPYLVANRAMNPVWPSVVLKPLKDSIVVREVTLKLAQAILLKFCSCSVSHCSIPPIHVLYHKMYVVSRDSYLRI